MAPDLQELGRGLRMAVLGRVGRTPRPEKWVFIVGCYNSGTTLLTRMLSAHPAVGSLPGEGQNFTDQLAVPRDHGLPRLWAARPELFRLDAEGRPGIEARRVKRQWGAHFNDPRRPLLLEKSIPNAARIPWLDCNFENAHFVSMVRDGYAVAEGIRRRSGHPIERAALQWARSNAIMLADLERVERDLRVSYEELTADPRAEWRRIAAFLELPELDVAWSDTTWEIHGTSSRIRNMNPVSFENLDEHDLDAIEGEALPLLRRLGYERPRPG